MARKKYSDEFKGDAVALYRDTEGATITQIAAGLGIHEATLTAWCKAAGVPIRHRKPRQRWRPRPRGSRPLSRSWPGCGPRTRPLRAEQTRLSTERDILRSAAKYFAGETNW